MDLLKRLIEVYESSSEKTADDVLSDVLRHDARFTELNREEIVQLKRDFFAYVRSIEEQESIEEREYQREDASEEGIKDYSYEAERLLRKRRRPHRKYVEAFVNNVSVPSSLEELDAYYLKGNAAQLLIRQTNTTETTNWTVPRWVKRGDIVLFMHAKTAKSTLTSLRTQTRSRYPQGSKKASALEKAIADQLAFHKLYGGKIFAIGRINGTPELVNDSNDPLSHWKTKIYCDIDDLFLLDNPIDISEFNDFIYISRQGAITPVYGNAYEELKSIIVRKNVVPEYFNLSYSTPFPHSLVNQENWMRLGLEYRNSFTLEIQFRQCYVDYLLKGIGDQKTIYMECDCYKGTNPITHVDNVIRINKKLLPVEVKLNIQLESDLKGQCTQYCKLDRLILKKKPGRDADVEQLIDDRVLVIDTYAVYMFHLNQNSLEFLYDLSDLQTAEDLLELRRIVIDHCGN